MKKTSLMLFFASLLAMSFTLPAQTPGTSDPRNPLPAWVLTNAQKRAEMERITNRDRNNNIMVVAPNRRRPGPGIPTTAAPMTREELEEMKAQNEAFEAKFGVDRNLRKKFESFLNLDNTGVLRVFPDKNCGTGKVVTLAEIERCADVPGIAGGGSILSFRCVRDTFFMPDMDRPQDPSRGFKSWDGCATKLTTDIQYKGGMFVAAGNGIVQGIMADIGDIDLATLTLDHKAFSFLDDYDPKQSLPKIAKQNEVLAKGISADGFTFTNAAPMKVNSTYVLRSVLYRYHEEGALSVPNRGVDVRVAFKVVGREADGSVIILWKELDRQYPRRKISDN